MGFTLESNGDQPRNDGKGGALGDVISLVEAIFAS